MATLEKINISLIKPSAMNPRKTFDQSLIEELAQNIAEQGLIQPITIRAIEYKDYLEDGEVVSVPSAYEVVCGERRFRAWSLLAEKKPEKYADIPAVIREMNDKEAFDAMITENLQRKDVDPIEEANAISLLMQRGDSTSDIAIRLGKSERFVTDRVKLANLIPELGKLLQDSLIPLTGAMMLAKLDDEAQKDYYEYNGGNEDSVSRIKEYVERSFGDLTSANFYDEDGFDPKLPLCSKCLNNTGNFKCLFYEMKGDNPRCTNRKCMQNKETEYLLYRVRNNISNMVLDGESLIGGKTVVAVEEAGSWWSTEETANRENFVAMLKELGVLVIKPYEYFTSKCYYDLDDDRTKQILESRKGYRVFNFSRNYRNGFKLNEEVWYLKADEKGNSVNIENIEAEKIESKIRRNNELKQGKIAEELRKWADDKKDYSEQKASLSSAEKIVFSVLLLSECGYSFRREIGLDNEIGSRTDDFGFVGKHSEDMTKWMRGFIRKKLSGGDVMYNSTLQRCQDMLFSDQYPKEYRELTEKINSTYDKKNDKLQEKLDSIKMK